jgi:hypothetical protein
MVGVLLLSCLQPTAIVPEEHSAAQMLSEPLFCLCAVVFLPAACYDEDVMKKGHNAMTHQPTFEQSLTDFLNAPAGNNRSAATRKAYAVDIHQFIAEGGRHFI